jgi:histidinol-phosphate aminotransferase
VLIDEAYVDFGGESAVPLIHKYDNLLVTQTFSKSRSLAGGRLGFGIGSKALIQDLNTLRYSTNPYNINRMTAAAGIATLRHNDEAMANCRTIIATRERIKSALRALGFTVTDSCANFLFAAHPAMDGNDLYLALRERGILVRHFSTPAIAQYNRITVGTDEQMDTLLAAVRDILPS